MAVGLRSRPRLRDWLQRIGEPGRRQLSQRMPPADPGVMVFLILARTLPPIESHRTTCKPGSSGGGSAWVPRHILGRACAPNSGFPRSGVLLTPHPVSSHTQPDPRFQQGEATSLSQEKQEPPGYKRRLG